MEKGGRRFLKLFSGVAEKTKGERREDRRRRRNKRTVGDIK